MNDNPRHIAIFLLILAAALILLPKTAAQNEGKITLLTVSNQEQRTGGTADLELIIKPGSGRIFFDSLPLTKLDTQISTRYANQVACDYLERDCSVYDFFYSIRSDSGIVGGPSAGAAMAVLTISVLEDIPLNNKVVITGTINSGGLVGPVAGITAKSRAAAQQGFTKVLVPKFEIPGNDTNETLFDVEVIQIGTLEEALFHFTGRTWEGIKQDIEIPTAYTRRMQEVANELCDRSEDLLLELEIRDSSYNETTNYTERLESIEGEGQYYAKASTCFSRNLGLQRALYQDVETYELIRDTYRLQEEIAVIDAELEARQLRTISDLEAYIIVKERLREAEESLFENGVENLTGNRVAYATERVGSARIWSKFFDIPGQQFDFDQKRLQNACRSKISEAEERINYVRIYLPSLTESSETVLAQAYADLESGEYALCLFRAGKAKAQANIVSAVIGVNDELVPGIVEEKLDAVEEQLLRQQRNDLFPILGYSYYEYASALLPYDEYSALTFSEYALEVGNLAPYFPKKNGFRILIDYQMLWVFVAGLAVGVLISIIIFRPHKEKTPAKKKSSKKSVRREYKKPKKTSRKRSLPGKKR